MESGRSASGVLLLPRTAAPLVDTQAVRELLTAVSSSGYSSQLAAAVQLAALLEVEEGRFRDVVGDPWGGPAGQRAAHSIGKLLACIKDRESVYDTVCESWILTRSVPLEQQVAGLRLVLACLSCWGFQYPLTEDRCMEQLQEWAGEGGDETPTPSDQPPADEEALLREARSVYATGLLSIAMANEDYAGQASSTPLVGRVAKYLRTALLDNPPPPRSTAAAAVAAAPDGLATGALAPRPPLCHSVTVLRRLRLQYCAALLEAVGEYLDALGPVLAERCPEALMELMRRYAGSDSRMLYDALGACVALTAHRRFSELFVEAGGVELVLALPRNPHTYSGIAMLLYSVAAAPLAFERLLAPGASQRGSAGPGPVVAAALSLLGCGQDSARKTAVTFLSSCMHYPATLREFQAQDGVRRIINLLRALLTSLRAASTPDLRMERQVGYYAALTLRMFVATHLVLHVGALRRGLAAASGTAGPNGPSAVDLAAAAAPAANGADGDSGGSAAAAKSPALAPVVPYRPVDTSREALDALALFLESDRRLAEAFARCRWPALEQLLDAGVPGLLLELVSALPPERWFHEAAQAALEALRLLTLAPLARRAVVTAVVPVGGGGVVGGGGQQRSGMGVLLSAATLSTSVFFASDPEVVSEALSTITNCVTAPPSLAPLLPSAAAAARAAAGAGGATPYGVTPARRPERHPASAEQQPPATAGDAGPRGEAAALHDEGSGGGGSCGGGNGTRTAPPGPGAPSLELGSAPAALGQALEAGCVLARQVVRQSNGIRSLMQLLAPRHAQGPNAVPAAALDRIRALACRALVGLAGDPVIRQILTRLQLARLLSDLVREPVGPTRRAAGVPLGPGLPYQRGAGVDWHAAFNSVALELIALTTTGAGPMTRQAEKFTAAANDATAPALHKIERAAIAAASHVSYSPQELLLLVYEHLKASGLHASAATLATEANLAKASAALHRLLHLQASAEPPHPLPAAVAPPGGGGGAAAAASAAAPYHHSGAAAMAGRAPAGGTAAAGGPVGHFTPAPGSTPFAAATGTSAPGTAACTPFGFGLGPSTGGGGGGTAGGITTCRKGRPIPISAALRDAAAAVRSRSDLSHDIPRLQFQQQFQQLHSQQQQQQMQLPPVTAAGGPVTSGRPSRERSRSREGSQQSQEQQEHAGALAAVAPQQQTAEHAAAAQPGLGALKRRASVPLPPAPHPLTRAATAKADGGQCTTVPAAPPLSGDGGGEGRAGGGKGAGKRGGEKSAASNAAVDGANAAGGRTAGRHGGGGGRRRGGSVGNTIASRTTAATAPNGEAEAQAAAAAGSNTPAGAPAAVVGEVGGEGQGVADGSGGVAAIEAGSASDADYLARAFGQQQQQHPRSAAATPQFLVRAKAMASPFATATTDRPTRPNNAAAPAAANAISSPSALLANLPSRKNPLGATAAALLKRHSSASTAAGAATPSAAIGAAATAGAAAAAPVPAAAVAPELPSHVEAAARDLHLLSRPPAMSKLHHIVVSYLRQQHRQAVMQSAVPTAMLPPISLSKPYVMPQATHALEAPYSVTKRVSRREMLRGHGGRGGARADSQLIYSRFRPLRTLWDDGSLSLCAAFMQGWCRLVVGTHSGELKLADPLEGEVVDVVDGHAGPVTQLRVHDDPGGPLLLSSSRGDVKLWAGSGGDDGPLPRGPRTTWDGVTRGRFNPDGSQIVAVGSSAPRQAMIFDVRTASKIAVLDPPPLSSAAGGGPSPGGGGSGGRTPIGGPASAANGGVMGGDMRRSGRGSTALTVAACYSPTGEMLLWGNCLYDLRSRSAIHQFDQFTDSGSATFHPAGLEVILNSEVWDLRTFKLLRSVPSLDGASVRFNGGGDVLYAARRQTDEPFSQVLHPRRARHPLHTAFRTLDAATYTDIATVAVERVVLDLAVEPSDSLVAVVAIGVSEEDMTASARVYEVGRRRLADDESDADEEDEEDSDGGSEDEDEDLDFGSDFDTPAPARMRRNRRAGSGDGAGGGGAAAGGAVAAAAAAARRLAAELFGEQDESGEDDDDEGGSGLAGLLGGGGGEDDDSDDGGGTDDEELGYAMLEDAYAALEEEDQDVDPELEDFEEEEDEEEDGEDEEEDEEGLLDVFLEDQEEDDEEDEDSDGVGGGASEEDG